MSSLLDWVGGSGQGGSANPGILGLGQYRADNYNVNQQAFNNPVGDQSGNWNSGQQNMLKATTGPAAQMGQTQLQGAQTYGGAQLGNTAQAGGAQIGPTSTYGGAQLNAGQYNSTFGQEQALANQLGAQARGEGPSIAQVQAQQQASSNMQQQAALLGSQRGSSNAAQAQTAALTAGAAAQQQAAQQAVLGRTQEALTAQGQQGQLLGSMNQQAQGFAGTNASMQQQAQLASMGAINAQNLAQAQMGQQNQQFNVGQLSAAQQAQAAMYQQAGLANVGAQNQFALQQGQMNQATNAANLQAQMQQSQLNAQQYNEYMNNLQQQNLAQYQGQMANQQLQVNQSLGIAQQQAASYEAAAKSRSKIAGGIMSAIGASDRRAKKNIGDATAEVENLLHLLARF